MFWWWPFGNVAQIEAEDLREQLRKDKRLQILDVRTAGEYAQGHIKGARLVPIHKLRGQLANLRLDRNRPVIVICQTAHRSVPAVRLLRRQGYDARQLSGGMKAWSAANYPELKTD